MDARGTFQSQIARIMDELAKAVVTELSNMLQLELKHREEQKHREDQKHKEEQKLREEQTQNLLKRLRTAERELQLLRVTRASAASEKSSVSVQVAMSDDALEYGGSSSQFFEEQPVQLLPRQEFHVLESDEDLEFKVKIEQVDEPKEEKCSQTESSRMAAEQDHFNSAYETDIDSTHYRTSVAYSENVNQQDYSGGFEQRRKDFFAQAEQCAAAHMFIQDSNCSLPNLDLCSIVPAKDSGHGEELSESGEHVQAQHSKKQARATNLKPHKVFSVNEIKGKHAQPLSEPSEVHKQSLAGLKLHHCRECGKRFTQRKRLISHQWVHTGERPFCCRICAKMFTRQDNCHRHERLHNNQ